MKAKSVVIPNPAKHVGMNAESFEKREKTIALVARLDIFQKRQDIMLKAMEIIKKDHPEYKLLLYGEGPDEAKLRTMADTLGVSDVVEFKGNVEHVANEVVKSQFLVLTSDFEGIPNAVIEGMSLGLTVISTDTSPGGARFLIQDGVNGRIVPREDYDGIASCISYYIKHPDEANAMAVEAKKVTNALSPETIQKQWVTVINKIVSDGKERV